MTKVVILTTGGTIASRYDAAAGALKSALGGNDLLTLLGPLAPDVDVAVEEFCNLGSHAIDLPLAFSLAKRIGQLLENDGVQGVVVTHGTDTMEESAWLADLMLPSGKPVVFTGAQYHAGEPDSDGPRNIADAIRVAASPQAHGLGAVIVFAQEIHAARDATKTHTSRWGTFASGEHGKLGEIDLGQVWLQRRPLRHTPLQAGKIETRVDLIKLAMGMDGRFIEASVQSGAQGIVLEGFGRGNTTPTMTEAAIAALERGVPVAVTSRVPQGRVAPLYTAGAELARAGGIFCGDLSGPKARILLALLLGSGADAATIRQTMENLG